MSIPFMKTIFIIALLVFVPVIAPAQSDEEPMPKPASSQSVKSPAGPGTVINKDIIVERLLADDSSEGAGTITFTSDSILFGFGSAVLKKTSEKQLSEIAAALNDPKLAHIPYFCVDGHTCSVGSADFNCRLSLKRARSVILYLTETGKVPKDKLKARGFGENTPVAPNDSETNRKKNRRVVITSGLVAHGIAETDICEKER